MVLSRAIANNIYTICGTPSLERRYPASRNGGFTAQEYSKISELKKVRSKSASKRALWNSTLKELNSLNRNIEVGELRCMDCNSTNITYKGQGKNSYSFDVSTPEMRKHIIDSIKEKIDNFSEDISRYDAEINKYQIELNRVMEEDDVTIENIVAFKSGFTSIEEIDSAITEIDNQIAKL